LALLDGPAQLDDLKTPPCNRLEKLRGDQHGQYSIRINDQYRNLFCLARTRCLRCWDCGLSRV